MDKKGEVGVFGLVLIAMAVIVGSVLLTSSAQNVGTMTNTYDSANVSFTLPANNTLTELTPCYQKNVSAVVIYDPTGALVLPSANYTVSQGASSVDGFLATKIILNNVNTTWAGDPANVSCTYEPFGYVSDSGSRTIVGLIIIFGALMLFAWTIPNLREMLGFD